MFMSDVNNKYSNQELRSKIKQRNMVSNMFRKTATGPISSIVVLAVCTIQLY